MDDLARFCCQNVDCSLYGRRDAGNLSVCDRYGKHKPIRLLYCNACKARFSERKGTPLFHSCLPQETAVSVLQHLVEGNGVRQTERLGGVLRSLKGLIFQGWYEATNNQRRGGKVLMLRGLSAPKFRRSDAVSISEGHHRRLTGVHRDTVMRLARLAGPHAKDTHDELVALSPSDP